MRWLIARWRPPRPPEQLTAEDQADLARVLAADPALAAGHALVQRFADALRRRDPGAFEAWLAAAGSSDPPPFVSLAEGMRADLSAIRNAFRLPWSTGPVEGHVHRLKLLKRQGYGRAKPALLRARVLAAN